jgi:acyl carrier protein
MNMSLDKAEVHTRVLEVLQRFLTRSGKPASIAGGSDVRTLGIDSLGFTELIFDLEDEFHVDDRSITDDMIANVRTVDDLTDMVLAASARS